jgi:hypothetical protein
MKNKNQEMGRGNALAEIFRTLKTGCSITLFTGAAILGLAAATFEARADYTIGSGVQVTTTFTNSGNGKIVTTAQTTDPIYLGITVTNDAQVTTNYICTAQGTAQASPIYVGTFVFRATDWGISGSSPANPVAWSTNFPAGISFTITNSIFFQVRPQTGGATPTVSTH